jgi:hypothetical protein
MLDNQDNKGLMESRDNKVFLDLKGKLVCLEALDLLVKVDHKALEDQSDSKDKPVHLDNQEMLGREANKVHRDLWDHQEDLDP